MSTVAVTTTEVPGLVSLVTTAVSIGVPFLVVLFYFEGLIVGKLLQPPVVFVGYIAVADPTQATAVAVAGGCIVAATIGQLTLYRGFNGESPEYFGLRRHVPYLDSIPSIVQARISDRRLGFIERQFTAYGGVAICLTNAVPVIRGLITVVAGTSAYPVRRFVLASWGGNCLYFVLLLAVSWGVVSAGRLVGM